MHILKHPVHRHLKETESGQLRSVLSKVFSGNGHSSAHVHDEAFLDDQIQFPTRYNESIDHLSVSSNEQMRQEVLIFYRWVRGSQVSQPVLEAQQNLEPQVVQWALEDLCPQLLRKKQNMTVKSQKQSSRTSLFQKCCKEALGWFYS